ncbi:MAG: glycosyl hydrolase, partial [Tepidisphaeraceae bacterium]
MTKSLTRLAFLAATLLLAREVCAGTLTITRGGTYSGKYESISIDTREPVVIENATLRGGGHLITSHYQHANVTIRNVRGFGENPDVAGRSIGRFASLEGFDNVIIENCHLEATAGIYLLDYAGDRTKANAVRIISNRARNIDGRRSDGNGGYQTDAELVQFAQLDKVRGVPGVVIAWNEVINHPDQSCVEDVISIYLSSGTKQSPIRIHDNFIRGAYPMPAAIAAFSGGGIMLGDGVADEGPAGDPGFVHAYDNIVLDTVNYGIATSAGHDCQIYRNRVLSAGVTADGKTIAAQNVGIYVWDSCRAGKKRFANNVGRNNLVGWVNKDGRNDVWSPHAAAWENNEHWPADLTVETYDAAWE